MAEDPALRRTILQSARIGLSWDVLAVRLPELELYFPVEQHRQDWQGKPGVRVAVELTDGTFLAWNADGTSSRFDSSAIGEEPTLFFGASEIDYDDAESARIGGSRTGDYLLKIADQARLVLTPANGITSSDVKSASGGLRVITSTVSTSQDTYLTFLRVMDSSIPAARWKSSPGATSTAATSSASVSPGSTPTRTTTCRRRALPAAARSLWRCRPARRP